MRSVLTALLSVRVYTVQQTKGWEGRELLKPFDVFVSENGETYRYLINNANFYSYVKVVKIDSTTGKTIPASGIGFHIYDPSGNQIQMTFTYPTVTTIDTFYTDGDGMLITPEKLEYGKGYSLVEVSAPYGYVLNSDPVYFDITEDGRFFKLYLYTAIAPIPFSSFAGEPSQNVGKSFIKSYAAVCLEGAIIVLACIIFSLFAASPPTIDPDAAAVSMVWSYIGEPVFNMLVLVGAVKMADRVVREMMGL